MVASFLDSATFLQTASPTMDSSKPTDNIEKEAPRQLNALVFHDVKTRINNVPSGDMTEFLEHQLKSYPTLRETFRSLAITDAQDNTCLNDEPTAPADLRVPDSIKCRCPPAIRRSCGTSSSSSTDRSIRRWISAPFISHYRRA